MNNLVLTNIKQLVGITENSNEVKKGNSQGDVQTINNAYLVIRDGIIQDFGPMNECSNTELTTHDCTNQLVMPMYVDSHTHLVFAKSRSDEMKMRLQGKSY